MHSLASMIASYMVNAAWEGIAIGAAGWIASLLLGRLGPRVQHVVWVTTLLLAVAMPALPFLQVVSAGGSITGVAPQPASVLFTAASSGQAVASSGLVLPLWLLVGLSAFYAGTLLYFAARFAWSLYSTRGMLRAVRPVSPETETSRLWHRCISAFGVGDACLLISDGSSGPGAMGVLRPKMLVPRGLIEECAPEDVLAAMAHECAHIRRHDYLKNLIYEIASLPIAFHPVCWVVKSQIGQTRELICDEMASEYLGDANGYAKSLLRLVTVSFAASARPVHAMGIFDANILERRIAMIRAKKERLSAFLKSGLLLAAVTVLVAMVAGTGAMAFPVQAKRHATQEVQPLQKSKKKFDLSCTYYDSQTRPLPGICEWRPVHRPVCAVKKDRKTYQDQVGCVWKLKRAGIK